MNRNRKAEDDMSAVLKDNSKNRGMMVVDVVILCRPKSSTLPSGIIPSLALNAAESCSLGMGQGGGQSISDMDIGHLLFLLCKEKK